MYFDNLYQTNSEDSILGLTGAEITAADYNLDITNYPGYDPSDIHHNTMDDLPEVVDRLTGKINEQER